MMRGGAWLTFSIFLSLTAVLGGVSAAGAAGGISLDATGRTDIELILDEATPEAIGVVAEVHGLGWEITESERGFFARLGLGEHGSAGDEGHPGLPAARRLLEIPWGAGVTVEVVAESHRDATLDELGMTHPPYPVQPPRRKDRRAGEYPFVYDEGAYGAASWTPDVIARVGRVGRMRGRELALLEIFPVAYLPSREMVRIYTRIEVRVHLEGGSPGTTEAEAERVRSFAFDRRFRHLLLNDGAYTGGERGFPPLPLGLLIITAPAYEAELAPLVSWKTKKGFDVAVVTTDVAGTTTGEIADYIAEAYNTWPIPPTYVLLVGDTDVIPTFTGLASGTEADLYYVTVSEGDYFPEMGLGRFPVRSTAQVATLVEKGVDLERLEISSGYAWLNKICFIAASDLGGFAENTHEYVIEQYVDPAGLSYDKIWERLGGSTQDIANSVNGGVTIVEYSGHGYEYGWSSVPFNQSDVRNLVNYDMYPFVISNACLTGSFGVSECYGETWPIVDGKGGISHWGASNYSYWDEDDILEKRMFRALFQENFSSVSGFTDRALEELWVYYGGAGRSQYYFDAYNVMGDPSLEIWAGTPDDMTASYPPALPMGVNEIEVWASSARDAVDSALCCVSDGSSVLGVAYTDLSGYAAVPLDPPLEDPGAYLLTVTRSGYVPHEGSFEIIASDGPYVLLEELVINDDGPGPSRGNADGGPDAGETLEITITVRNAGNETAPAVTTSLGCADDYAEVVVGDHFFGDLLPGESRACADPYILEIAPDCPDQYALPVVFQTVSGDSVWTSTPGFTVEAPVLEVTGYQLDDSALGDGDGVAEPGETAEVSLRIANTGSEEARYVSSMLYSLTPDVTVVSGASAATLIPSGGEELLSPAATVSVAPGAETCTTAPLMTRLRAWLGYEVYRTFDLQVGGLFDDAEGGEGGWTHYAVTGGYVDQWHWSSQRDHTTGSGHSWKQGSTGSGDYADNCDAALVSLPVTLGEGTHLTFWHWMSAEVNGGNPGYAYDGAIVEMRSDGGSWQRITPAGGYPYLITGGTGNPLPAGTPCWSGSFGWTKADFDLTGQGGVAEFRFRFATDMSVSYEGWYVDDVRVAGTGPEGAAVETEIGVPGELALLPNRPNPFNPVTTISFTLPAESEARLSIFDVEGRLVRTLAEGVLPGGTHHLSWDGMDEGGRRVASGVYFYRLEAQGQGLTRRMVLVK